MTALLSVMNLSAGYGGSEVLGDVCFDIAPGEVVCLLGANGAGEDDGHVGHHRIAQRRRGARCSSTGRTCSPCVRMSESRLGFRFARKGRQVFPNLSVEENLLLGSFHRAARAGRAGRLGQAYTLFPQLAGRRRQLAGSLSGGEQQMLAISRALMAGPRLLLLDEPSLGLSPKMVLIVFEAIRAIARSAISILLVEQNTQAALSVASRGYVLRGGRIVHADTRAGLRESRIVQDAFFGRGRPMRADADA